MLNRLHLKSSSDEELMNAVRKDHRAAFGEIYERYQPRLLFFLRRLLGYQNDRINDILHDVFVKVMENSERFDPQWRFSTWIFTIAHNRCKNEFRDKQREPFSSLTDRGPDAISPSFTEQVDKALDGERFEQALLQVLERFDSSLRSAFILRYQENMPPREIARILKCPEGTIKSRLHYLSKKLADMLHAYHPNNYEV